MTDFSVELADLDLREVVTKIDMQPEPAPVEVKNLPTVPSAKLPAQVSSGTWYQGVDADIADEARETADRIRKRMHGSIIDTGKDLLAVKDKLGHGSFTGWLQQEFGWSERTAQNYMSAAALAAEYESVAVLQPTAIYSLAAKSTPASVPPAVVEEIKKGTIPSAAEIKERIAKARAEEAKKKAEARRLQKETPEQAAKRKKAEARAEQKRKQEDADRAVAMERRKKAALGAINFLKKNLPKHFEGLRKLVLASEGQFDVVLRSEKNSSFLQATV
ncbi:DUF3102 domain-containing protein [Aquibium sp. LZ166]|uniref:DUF3102 domain-containing protein n=1 Tax=Aquibium pacificus TaxID=3153579 RepID=A0ABV3SQG4_9HYPH